MVVRGIYGLWDLYPNLACHIQVFFNKLGLKMRVFFYKICIKRGVFRNWFLTI